MSRHSILVTDGEHRSSLAVVRSLGRQGHRVTVAANRRGSLAGASRYSHREIVLPSPYDDPKAFVESIVDACSKERIEVVLPTTDASLLALLPARSRLAPAVIPIGSEAAYRAASDKAYLNEIAPRFGIAVPRQLTIQEAGEAEKESLSFPVVVKPSRSVSDESSQLRRLIGTQYANDRDELRALLESAPAESYPLLIQERIIGPGIGVFLLLWQNEEIAAFSHRRLREKPPGGGVSVYAESVEPDGALVARSRELLSHLGFEGVAMVEYKVHRETGVPYLLEVNGRFWGSLQLAIDAGVDFPQLLISAAVDGIIPEKPLPRSGIRLRWWWGDVDHLLTRLRRSARELGLPPDAASRWQTLREFLRARRPGERHQIWRFDDPHPAFRETIDWFRGRG